jgi:thiamine biosynthesis lipoprotein
MGTQYRVTADCPVNVGAEVVAELSRVNQEMSTYDPTSTLSRFNRSPPGDWFAVSADLVHVVAAAAQLSAASGGAFDVTVGPLVNLWGFGPDESTGAPPLPGQLQAALARVGHAYLQHRARPPGLRKQTDIYVDLSAIAKGYGVDRLAELLIGSACANFLVEIGGEVRAHGKNEQGVAWRVGVEVPDPSRFGAVQRVLQPGEQSIATSGDYRNFLEVGGVRVSHTIDPRTGRPVNHRLASVTVVHDSAMWADGYATLLNVLGPRAGLEFAQETGLAALFIERAENGFEERYTPAMELLLGIN